MRRRLVTLLGIISPLVLLFLVCSVGLILAGLTTWWLLDQDSSAKIIRIVSLAPLTTPSPPPSTNGTQPVSEVPASESESGQESSPLAPTATPASIDSEDTVQSADPNAPPSSTDSTVQEKSANRLVIPKINLESPIILSPLENNSWKVDHLGQSVGYLEQTAQPGSNSNFVLAAHVTLANGSYGPFASLSMLAPGDVIQVYHEGIPYEYIIDGHQVVDRSAVHVTNSSDTAKITLITCSNWDASLGRYVERLVVTGRLKQS